MISGPALGAPGAVRAKAPFTGYTTLAAAHDWTTAALRACGSTGGQLGAYPLNTPYSNATTGRVLISADAQINTSGKAYCNGTAVSYSVGGFTSSPFALSRSGLHYVRVAWTVTWAVGAACWSSSDSVSTTVRAIAQVVDLTNSSGSSTVWRATLFHQSGCGTRLSFTASGTDQNATLGRQTTFVASHRYAIQTWVEALASVTGPSRSVCSVCGPTTLPKSWVEMSGTTGSGVSRSATLVSVYVG